MGTRLRPVREGGAEAALTSEERQIELLERLVDAVEDLRSRLAAPPPELGETVDVDGAAKLLKTTQGGIYARHRRGKMPRRLPGRRLVWRTADLLRLAK